MTDGKQLYNVTIEWDGQKPSTTWYRRLSKLALSRGNKIATDSPLSRRQSHNKTGKGVMLQEGCFLVDSESLAHTIALYAMNGLEVTNRKTKEHTVIYPAHVMVSKVETINPEHITAADREAINRINSTYGRRGKPLPSIHWIVSCYECMVAHEAYAPAVAVCPECHGTRIELASGIPTRYDLSQLEGKFPEYVIWETTRFINGVFHLPAAGGKVVDPPVPPSTVYTLPKGAADLAFARTPLCEGDLEDTLHLMDAVYIARQRLDPTKRLAARVDTISKYIQFGGDAVAVAHLFSEDPAHADILDAALLLGSEHVATLLLHQTMGVKP